MRLNADFSKRVIIRPTDYKWIASPMPGVSRMMLDRIGEEDARATSLVRYAPNSTFSSHCHVGGEEFYVLEGTFQDEHGLYPKGSYVRNPIGTSHTPQIGDDGALILVKLQQFDSEDTKSVSLRIDEQSWTEEDIFGRSFLLLHHFKTEKIYLVRLKPHQFFPKHIAEGGEEIFVLDGEFYDEHGHYPKGSWVRAAKHEFSHPYTKKNGALLYYKSGHLSNLL